MENSNISEGANKAMKACADMYPLEHNLQALANAYRQKALDMLQADVRSDEFGHTPMHYMEFWERISKLADSAHNKARFYGKRIIDDGEGDGRMRREVKRDWKSKDDRAYDRKYVETEEGGRRFIDED